MKKLLLIPLLVFALLLLPKTASAGEIGIDVGGAYKAMAVQQYDAFGKVILTTPDVFSSLNINWIRTVGSSTGTIPPGKSVLAVYQNNCGDPNAEQTFIDQVKSNNAIKAVQVGNEVNKEPDPPKIGDDYFNCTPEGYVKQIIHFYDELKDSKTVVFGSPYLSDDLLQSSFNVDPTNTQAGYINSKNFKIYNFVINYFTRFYSELVNLKRTDILQGGQALRIGLNLYINEGETKNSAYNIDRLNAYINAIKNLQGYQNSKFWITEFGWRSAPDYLNSKTPDEIDQIIQTGKNYSPKNQADFDRDATRVLQGRSDVEVAFLFSLHDVLQAKVGSGEPEWRNLGLIDHRTNTLKPVFYEIKNLTNPGPQKGCDDVSLNSSNACVANAQKCMWQVCGGNAGLCVDSGKAEDCAVAEARAKAAAEAARLAQIAKQQEQAIAEAKNKANEKNKYLNDLIIDADGKPLMTSYCVFLIQEVCESEAAKADCAFIPVKNNNKCMPKDASGDNLNLHELWQGGSQDKITGLRTAAEKYCKTDQDCNSSAIAHCAAKINENRNLAAEFCIRGFVDEKQQGQKNSQFKQKTIDEICALKPAKDPANYNFLECSRNADKNDCRSPNIYDDYEFELCIYGGRQEEVNRAKAQVPPPPGAPPQQAPGGGQPAGAGAATQEQQQMGAPAAAPLPAAKPSKSASDFCDYSDETCWQTFELCKSEDDPKSCLANYGIYPSTKAAAQPAAQITNGCSSYNSATSVVACRNGNYNGCKTIVCNNNEVCVSENNPVCPGENPPAQPAAQPGAAPATPAPAQPGVCPPGLDGHKYCEKDNKTISVDHCEDGVRTTTYGEGGVCDDGQVCQNGECKSIAPIDQLRNALTNKSAVDNTEGAWCGEAVKNGATEKDCYSFAENTCAPQALKEPPAEMLGSFTDCIKRQYKLDKFASTTVPAQAAPAAPADGESTVLPDTLAEKCQGQPGDCVSSLQGKLSSCQEDNASLCIDGLIAGWLKEKQIQAYIRSLKEVCRQSISCYNKISASGVCPPDPDKRDQASFNNCVEDFQIHNPIKDRNWQVNILNALCAHAFGPDNQTSDNCVSAADNQCKDFIIEGDFTGCVNKVAEGLGAKQGQKFLYKVTMNCPGAQNYNGDPEGLIIYKDGKPQDQSFTIPDYTDRIACEIKEFYADGSDLGQIELQTVIFTNSPGQGLGSAPKCSEGEKQPVGCTGKCVNGCGEMKLQVCTDNQFSDDYTVGECSDGCSQYCQDSGPGGQLPPIPESCREEAREEEGGVVQNFVICTGKAPEPRGSKYCFNGNPNIDDCSAAPGEGCTYEEGEPFCPEGEKHSCGGVYNEQGICQYKEGVETNCTPCQ